MNDKKEFLYYLYTYMNVIFNIIIDITDVILSGVFYMWNKIKRKEH